MTIIRLATIDDLPSIVEIYNQAIRSRTATGDMDEFMVENRVEWFKKYQQDTYPLYVAESNEKIVGYCTISPYREGRRAMSEVAEISYYLYYSFHRQGIGTALLEYAISDCQRIGIKHLLAILLDINQPSINLLEKLKFEQWGHLPDIINLDGGKCGQFIYGRSI
ncbi:N-acetyltransferase [candidate division KSB1 bacterium]|nr:N-acetyltransferase [candidate division KSB1 bacterium]